MEKSKELLIKSLEIQKITVPETSDEDELNSIILVLKQILKFLGNEESPSSKILESNKLKIKSIDIVKDSKLQLSNDILTVPLKFSESDFKEFIFQKF